MSKRVLLAVAALLGLCVSVSAQEFRDFGSFQTGTFGLSPLGLGNAVNTPSALGRANLFGTLNNAWYGPAPLTLADGRLFSFPGAFAWTQATALGYLPAAALQEPVRVAPAATRSSGSGNATLNVLPQLDYVGGEVGFFYGKSNGKFGRAVKGGYIIGEIVDGNTHISVGASYEHASGRVPILIGR